MFSVKRFLQYLFNESRQTPVMASSWIQRWALTLGAYKCTIRHKPGSKMAHDDGLSLLSLPHKPSFVHVQGDLTLLTNHLSKCIITANHIKAWTDKDPV